MNRATKSLLVVGAVIVLSYPGITWVTGLVIESRLQHAEQQVLARAPYLTLLSRQYHRGVYRSTQTLTYGFQNPALGLVKVASSSPSAPRFTITVESTIAHGPFPGLRTVALATVDTTVIAPPALQKLLSGVPGSSPILRISSKEGFLGGGSAELRSPNLNLRFPDGTTLAWAGLTGTVTTNWNGTRWSGELTAPRLAVQGAQGRMELSGLEYSGSHEKAFDDLYLGTGTFTIEQVKGSSARSGEYSLERISFTSASKTDGEFFDLRVDAAMDAAKLGALRLMNLRYSESIEHVHGPSFASMMRAMRLAERQAGANAAQLQAGMRDALRRYGVEVLLHDPVLDIRQVSFEMPEGSFLFSARISAPGLSRSDLQWPAFIVALQRHAEVTADLRIDNGLLQKLLATGGSNPRIAAQLTSLEQQGFLAAGPSAVTTHLEFSAGKLTLNGHPFPPTAPAN
ncbi:MAG: YdgA family protein [Steroidobacteraceae bacterium]